MAGYDFPRFWHLGLRAGYGGNPTACFVGSDPAVRLTSPLAESMLVTWLFRGLHSNAADFTGEMHGKGSGFLSRQMF